MSENKAVSIDAKDFDSTVLQSAQPVLVDFWAEWCGPCKMIAPVLDEIAADRAESLKVVKVDIERNPDLAARFNVRSIPTLLIFQNGNVAGVIQGAQPKSALLAKIDATLGARA